MPLKKLTFEWVKFRPEVIRAALETFERYLPKELRTGKATQRIVDLDTGVHWEHDTDEEFFSDYRQPCSAMFSSHRIFGTANPDLTVAFYSGRPRTEVSVRLPERFQVEEVFEVFASRTSESLINRPTSQPPPQPHIFIGHGQSKSWRDLYDHLRDQQKLHVTAFESDPQAGKITKDVLIRMATGASFALLVHTAEDEQADSTLRARQNVVHETGFFQGRLGFERAIILREDGCESLTNLAGVQEIRYPVGRIRETFGDVVATIRREFPETAPSH
jgi:Predicted nucleotide-binding protein containing TIR-like domain